MNLKNKLGKRIKELRKNKRLSQEKLSEMIDIAQNTLSGIENGDNFCTAETLEKIITSLEIEPVELFDFGHQKDNETLLIEINKMLKNTPEKIPRYTKLSKLLLISLNKSFIRPDNLYAKFSSKEMFYGVTLNFKHHFVKQIISFTFILY